MFFFWTYGATLAKRNVLLCLALNLLALLSVTYGVTRETSAGRTGIWIPLVTIFVPLPIECAVCVMLAWLAVLTSDVIVVKLWTSCRLHQADKQQ